MTLQTLPAHVRWNLFKVQGQLNLAAAPTVQTALVHAAQLGATDLLIDLEDLETADQAGIWKLTSTVAKLIADRPSLHVAFVAKDAWVAGTLKAAQLPSVTIFCNGSDALRAIGMSAAA